MRTCQQQKCLILSVDNDVLFLLVEESKNYLQFINFPNPQITLNEMRCFSVIQILQEYCQLPGKKSYWNTNRDLGNQVVIDAIRRDCFIIISSNIIPQKVIDDLTKSIPAKWIIIDAMSKKFNKSLKIR